MHVLVRAFWAAFEQADSPEERSMRLLEPEERSMRLLEPT